MVEGSNKKGDPTGLMHILAHKHCDSIHKTCTV